MTTPVAEPTTSIEFWIGFNVVVLILVALDLGVFHRKSHAMSMREALGWSVFWIFLALCFNCVVYWRKGPTAAQDFLLGYLMEKSLSVDNLFVFVLIFKYFNVPPAYQRRVLSLGIVGALVMRAIFIGMGAFLLAKFHWMTYVFGGFLVWTGGKMLLHDEDEELDPGANPAVKLFRRFFPTTNEYHGHHFLIREGGRLIATPLLVVLIVVESSDVVFAVDSIPAIFGVTRDPFIVYTSNVCAILGLRALYFMLAGMLTQFRFLKLGISIVLIYIGIKMLISGFYKIDSMHSLLIVGAILAVSVIGSWVIPVKDAPPVDLPPPSEPPHGSDTSI
jgi:tellurite resistance protein TerC